MNEEALKRRVKQFAERFELEFGNEWELLTEYAGYKSPVTVRHIPCGKYVTMIVKPVEFILMRGDGHGAGIKCDCQKPPKRCKEYDALIRVLKKRMDDLHRTMELDTLCKGYESTGYEILEIHNDKRHITMRHTKCGRAFVTDIWRMRKGYGCIACARCGTSYGVQQIEQYLKNNGILFDREVTFPSCKRERMLPFDFAVYDDDCELKCLIEFQGEQHYRASDLFGGEEKLRRVQEADAIKRQWAKDHGINLIVIDWNENINGRMSTADL